MVEKTKEVIFTGSVSLVTAGICTNLSVADAIAKLNMEHGGVSTGWQLADDVKNQGMQCPDHEDCKHYFFIC